MVTTDHMANTQHSALPVMLDKVEVRRKTAYLLGPASLEIGTKEHDRFTMVIGPNGSGKTTLLKLLHGLERADAGNLHWNLPAADIAKRLSFVFQTPVMLRRTALENVAYPLLVQGISKASAMKQAEIWLEKVGLAGFGNNRANLLSGGEKQKLAIARALITQPDILLLDEPTANLDGAATLDIETLLKEACNKNTRIIMATHDMGQIRRLATSVIFLYRGKVHEHNPVKNFPQTQKANAFINGEIVL